MKYLMLAPFLLFFVIGWMMAFEMIPPNSHVGFRSGRTLGSEAIWYSVNTNVGWSLVLTSAAGALFVWRIFASRLDMTIKSLTATAALIILATITVIVGVAS
ncbi:MAG: SdpI family protein [Gemmobacter sp.]